MAKYPPKHPESQSNRRTSIHHHYKVNIPKKLQQQSYQKTEATKVNAIMEKLDELDGNGHHRKKNINHFTTIYKSDNKEGTQQSTKSNTPIIVLSEKETGRRKIGQNKINEEDGNDC